MECFVLCGVVSGVFCFVRRGEWSVLFCAA